MHRVFYYGKVSFDLYNSSTSYTADYNPTTLAISDTLLTSPRWINMCTSCRIVAPTWSCVDAQIAHFDRSCTGWCKFRCKVSDIFFYGACSGGEYLGAAALCSTTNNAIIQ